MYFMLLFLHAYTRKMGNRDKDKGKHIITAHLCPIMKLLDDFVIHYYVSISKHTINSLWNLIHLSCCSISEPCILLNIDKKLPDISCRNATYIFSKIISVLCMDSTQ